MTLPWHGPGMEEIGRSRHVDQRGGMSSSPARGSASAAEPDRDSCQRPSCEIVSSPMSLQKNWRSPHIVHLRDQPLGGIIPASIRT
jgi:hypothetical protein